MESRQSQYEDVHELTMSIFTSRISTMLTSFDIEAPPEVVKTLAGLMNMTAHERVLDEAAVRELPDPEHPAVRNLRDQLSHTQAAVDVLATLAERRFEQLAETMSSTERYAVGQFVDKLRRSGRAIMSYAGSTATTEATRMAYDEVLNDLMDRVALIAADDSSEAHAVRGELFSIIAAVQSSRAALFRDAARIEASRVRCAEVEGGSCDQNQQCVAQMIGRDRP